MTHCHTPAAPPEPRPAGGRRGFPRAAAVCLLLAALVAAGFAAGASAVGKASPPANVAIGAGWVFTLALIVSAPLLVPRLGRGAAGGR